VFVKSTLSVPLFALQRVRACTRARIESAFPARHVRAAARVPCEAAQPERLAHAQDRTPARRPREMGAGASHDFDRMVKEASVKQLQEQLASMPSRDKIMAAVVASEAAAKAPAGGEPAFEMVEEVLASGEPVFEMSTPMLVMPYTTFKEQGRICKSTAEWRNEALAEGWLVEHAKVVGGSGKVQAGVLDGTVVVTEGKVVIFISHTWWDPGAHTVHALATALCTLLH